MNTHHRPNGGSHLIVIRLVLCALLILGTPLSTHAAPSMSRDQAAAQVREQTGGRVLGVKVSEQNDSVVYAVKVVLPDGRVRIVEVYGSR